jgi:hypothetical protein
MTCSRWVLRVASVAAGQLCPNDVRSIPSCQWNASSSAGCRFSQPCDPSAAGFSKPCDPCRMIFGLRLFLREGSMGFREVTMEEVREVLLLWLDGVPKSGSPASYAWGRRPSVGTSLVRKSSGCRRLSGSGCSPTMPALVDPASHQVFHALPFHVAHLRRGWLLVSCPPAPTSLSDRTRRPLQDFSSNGRSSAPALRRAGPTRCARRPPPRRGRSARPA